MLRELVDWAEYELSVHHTWVALVLGCGVHGDRDAPPAQRSQLLKLRGDGNTEARMRIARSLGVRVGAKVMELGRLRRAASVWRGQLRTVVAVEDWRPRAPVSSSERGTSGADAWGGLVSQAQLQLGMAALDILGR